MDGRSLRLGSWALAGTLMLVLAACGKTNSSDGLPTDAQAVSKSGSVGLTTQNTSRLGGSDATVDAAAVARAVYPGLTLGTRPQAVTIVSSADWRSALATSVLVSSPLRAPLLYSGATVPAATTTALRAMAPTGSPAIAGSTVIRVGTAAVPAGYRTLLVGGSTPYSLAASIERLSAAIRGHEPARVIVVSATGPPSWAMPAAGLSAESGAPILFVGSRKVPLATREALADLHRPTMYVIGSTAVISSRLAGELKRYGPVRRIGAADAVANAVAVARFADGTFGWDVVDPGHGFVFANASRPLDAAAAAPLSDGGEYGPLLLLADSHRIPAVVARYLISVQPGYTANPRFSPVRGVYNRGWLIGDSLSISPIVQAKLDGMLAITSDVSTPVAPITTP
jgi:hypothetical protein